MLRPFWSWLGSGFELLQPAFCVHPDVTAVELTPSVFRTGSNVPVKGLAKPSAWSTAFVTPCMTSPWLSEMTSSRLLTVLSRLVTCAGSAGSAEVGTPSTPLSVFCRPARVGSASLR